MRIVFGVGRSTRTMATCRNIVLAPMKMIMTDVEHLGKSDHVQISEYVRNACY